MEANEKLTEKINNKIIIKIFDKKERKILFKIFEGFERKDKERKGKERNFLDPCYNWIKSCRGKRSSDAKEKLVESRNEINIARNVARRKISFANLQGIWHCRSNGLQMEK
jgi:hypothetical protein